MTSETRLVLTLLVFSATILLVLIRPRGWNEAWWAAGGALLMLAGRLETPRQAWRATRAGQDALLFLLALLLLSALLARSGFFEWAAIQAARLARGDARRLYRNTFLLGALVTAALSLDTTAVILTPVVLAFVGRLRLPARPYVFACALVANAASLPLPISNLTNLLLAGPFRLGFGGFFLRMLLPQCAALLVVYILCRRLFRADLPAVFAPDDLPDPHSVVPHAGYFRASVGGLGLVLAGYFFAPLAHVPAYAVAFAACLVLSVWGWRAERVGWTLLGEISWPVFPFVAGLLVLLGGVEALGVTGWIASWVGRLTSGSLAGMGVVAGGAGLASNLVNNVPAALLARGALVNAHAGPPFVYAVLLGTDIGPTLTLSGSLATLLVLTVARKSGAALSGSEFLRVGLLVTPAALAVALLTLWLTFRLVP